MFNENNIFSYVLLIIIPLILSGCGGENFRESFEKISGGSSGVFSEVSTVPSINTEIQSNYKSTKSSLPNSLGAFTKNTFTAQVQAGNSISKSEMEFAKVKYLRNIEAYNKLGNILTGDDSLSTNPWNPTTTYNIPGNTVSYTYGNKFGIFVNSWWTKDNPPSFIPNSSNPWKLIKRTDATGDVISIAEAVESWSSVAVYTGGKIVLGDNRICYEAKYWTKNNNPNLVETVIYSWETPWQASTKCSSIDDAVFGDVEVNPIGGGKPPIDLPPPTIDDNSDDGTPVIPPVIPAPEPVVPPAAPLTPINIAGSNDGLPIDGYEFLRQVTDIHWDWLFPLRSGKYNVNGGTRNQAPFANSNGSTDLFSLANFKKSVLKYNAYAKANGYKQFLNEGNLKQQAQEFIVFWAKSARETSGSWSTASTPWITTELFDGVRVTVWRGALYWIEEVGYSTDLGNGRSTKIDYVDNGSQYTPAEGRSYYGRGVIQLSWNYNYGAFSSWLYDNGITFDGLIDARDTLLKRPDYVATKGDLSILSGIWFWMTPQGAKPSSHDVIFGDVYNISKATQDQGLPQRNDGGIVPAEAGDTTNEAVFSYRLGTVINIVNGGLECNRAAKWHGGPRQRVSYYNAFSKYFNSQISGLNVTTLSAINGAGIWDMQFSASSSEVLKSAVCFNQKSYYGW